MKSPDQADGRNEIDNYVLERFSDAIQLDESQWSKLVQLAKDQYEGHERWSSKQRGEHSEPLVFSGMVSSGRGEYRYNYLSNTGEQFVFIQHMAGDYAQTGFNLHIIAHEGRWVRVAAAGEIDIVAFLEDMNPIVATS